MADNSVFITGTASGAFTEAFSDLPPWATEATALQIEKYLRKSFEIQSKTFDQIKKCCMGSGGGKMSAEEVKKINDELDKLGRNLKRTNEEDLKAQKRRKDREKQENEELQRGRKQKDADAILQSTLSALSASGSAVIGVNKDYIDVYDSLYQSGINVLNGNNSTADGFESLNQVVNLTGLRLQTLQKVAEKYASTINASGFNKFAKAISLGNARLNELGFSSEAQAELIGTLMESEIGYADIRRKSAQEIANDAVRLGAQFDRLSKTVGMSREQLQENLKATSKSIDSAFVFAKFGKDAADKLNAATAGIKDSNLREMFMQLAAASNPAQVESYRKLVEAGQGDLAQQLDMLAKQAMSLDPTEFQKRLSSLTSYMEQQTGRMGNLTNLLGQGGEEAARIINGLYQQGRSVTDATAPQEDAARKTQASIARLQTEIEDLSSTLQAAFFPMISQVNMAAGALNKLNSSIDGAIAAIEAETRSWIGIGIAIAGLISTFLIGKTAISKVMGSITKSAGSIGSVLGKVGGSILRLAAPIAALYAALQFGLSIGETLREMVTGVKETINYFDIIKMIVSDLGDAFKKGWEIVSNFFSELGSKISTKFLEFSNAISSAAQSLYNGIIGIGKKILEYVPWLNTVGEYLKKTIDVIGSVVKEIVDTGKKLLDILKEFVSSVLSKFANKMTFGLFGGEKTESSPVKVEPTVQVVTPMKPPSEISVPTAPMATTISSPSAITTDPTKENSTTTASAAPTPVPTIPGLDKPAKTADINNLLSYQGSILEQILLSTNNLVSVNKDILRYTRTNV